MEKIAWFWLSNRTNTIVDNEIMIVWNFVFYILIPLNIFKKWTSMVLEQNPLQLFFPWQSVNVLFIWDVTIYICLLKQCFLEFKIFK